MSSITKILLFACATLLAFSGAHAQSWPPATVKIVVPYPAGAEPDVLARDLANVMAKRTGKAFVVENRPGANAIIGTDVVAKAPGDGATLLMVDRLSVVTNPVLYSKLPYDWRQQLAPVTDIAAVRLFLAIGPDVPAKDLRQFVDYAKANPGKVNVGIAGNGHVNHIGMAMLAQSEGFTVSYVPYKGLPPAIVGFLGGEVDALLAGGLVMQQMVKAKPIKVIAVGDTKRAAYLPDVPTVTEGGAKAGTIPSTVFSLFAPGSTTPAMVQDISAQFAAAMDDAFVKRYVDRGLEVKASKPSEIASELKREGDHYERVIKELGIRLE